MRARILCLLAATACGSVGWLGCNSLLGNEHAELFSDAESPVDTSDAESEPDVDDGGPDVDVSVPDADAGCPIGQKLCNGECVSRSDPLHGCGAAACTPCAIPRARAVCADDVCAVGDCTPGFADCNQAVNDGCETDLSQATHCGTCNAVCNAASPVCAPAGGGFNCTTGCTATAPTLCGSQCVDLQTSPTHCGGCNNVCDAITNGVATCTTAHCGFTCNASFHACGTGCSSNADPGTCGKSCTPCPTGPNAQATCDGTTCGIQCGTGFANCDNNASNGCEVTLATDSLNCGACGHACGAAATCVGGECVVADAGAD